MQRSAKADEAITIEGSNMSKQSTKVRGSPLCRGGFALLGIGPRDGFKQKLEEQAADFVKLLLLVRLKIRSGGEDITMFISTSTSRLLNLHYNWTETLGHAS